MEKNTSFNIGIDFGGVLSPHNIEICDEHINTVINMPYAFENLLKLKQLGHKLFIISYCGKNRAIETKKSLEETMISDTMSYADLFDRIYFVKYRKYKKDICEYLQCHFMVDDRDDIQEEIIRSESHTIPILFGKESHPSFITANDWNDVTHVITSTPYFSTDVYIPEPTKTFHHI